MSSDKTSTLTNATRRIIYFMTGCLAFQSTGVSMLFTVFARKIGAVGQGVEVFGISATAFSLAALVAAPTMGVLADRFGRRRLLLGSLAAHALASLGYLLAPTGAAFIAVRALAGGLTAGLVPASISMIGDLTPQTERGRWLGFMTGWSAIGFVIGPPLGGWVFDHWGLPAPFLIGAATNTLAFLIALCFIPNTALGRQRPLESHVGTASAEVGMMTRLSTFKIAIPRPYHTWVMLGTVSFIAVFAWRFVEPQFHFYIYDILGWTSARFGLVMSGLVIHTAQYVALITTDSVIWITLGIAASGLGEGLFMPALNAYLLDITPEQNRAQMIGLKESMFSLGGLVGPALVVLAVRYLQPAGIFTIAGLLILFSAFLVPISARIEMAGREN